MRPPIPFLVVLLAVLGCGGETPRHEEVLRGTLDALEELTAALADLGRDGSAERELRRLDDAIDGLTVWLDRAPHLPPISAEEERALRERLGDRARSVREAYAAEQERVLADGTVSEAVAERLERLRRFR